MTTAEERIKQVFKDYGDVEYLCPICGGHLILTTKGFWCPLHGQISPEIMKIKKKERTKQKC